MVRKAVNATLREILATRFAGMMISIAVVVQFGAALEVLEDYRIGLAAHLVGLTMSSLKVRVDGRIVR